MLSNHFSTTCGEKANGLWWIRFMPETIVVNVYEKCMWDKGDPVNIMQFNHNIQAGFSTNTLPPY